MTQRNSNQDDGGLIDLNALLGDVTARTPAAPPPSGGQGPICDPLASVPNDVYLLVSRAPPPPPETPPPHRDSLRAVTNEPVVARPMPARQGARVAIAVALSCLAAGSALHLARPSSARVTSASATVAATPWPATAAPSRMSGGSDVTGATAVQAPEPMDADPITTIDLPDTPPAMRAGPSQRMRAPGIAPTAAVAAAAAPASMDAAPSEVASAEVAPIAPPPEAAPPPASDAVPQPVNLEKAMQQAVVEDKPAPTQATASNVGPRRPALGAVSAAIRAVLPTARACVGPSGVIREASLVFASDGTVTRVDLLGSGAADDCLRAALGNAKLPPFVEPTFSTRITVRP